MSYNNNYNNNYSNYGFGSNNYSNFTNYTTPRQDKVSQVANLLEKCSIGELENIEKQLSYIKQRKKQEFYSNVYTFFLNYYNNVMMMGISEEDLKVAMTYLNQNGDISYSNDCRQHLFNYMRLKRDIEKILSLRDYSYLYDISSKKDIKYIKTKAERIFQNAQAVINNIQKWSQYEQTLKSIKQEKELLEKTKEQEEKAKAQAQELMQNEYFTWFNKMRPLWDGDPHLFHFCLKAEQILLCKKEENTKDFDIEKIAGILGCQIKDVKQTLQQFMNDGEKFLCRKQQGMYEYPHQSPNNNYNGKNKGLGMVTSGNTCGF